MSGDRNHVDRAMYRVVWLASTGNLPADQMSRALYRRYLLLKRQSKAWGAPLPTARRRVV